MLPKMDERGKINAHVFENCQDVYVLTLMLLVTLRFCDFGWGILGWAKYDKSLKSKKSSHSTKMLSCFKINSNKRTKKKRKKRGKKGKRKKCTYIHVL